MTDSLQTAGSQADLKLDALIAKIHGLSGGKSPAALAEEPPRAPEGNPRQPELPPRQAPPADRATPDSGASPTTGLPDMPPEGTPRPTEKADAAAPPPGPRISPRPSAAATRASGPLGFTPSLDEPWRPAEPRDLKESGASESLVTEMILRFLLNLGECEGRGVADQLKLPYRIIEPILATLKREQQVAYRNATATNDYVYVLTEAGRIAARASEQACTYFGCCPVRLRDYIASVRHQSIEGQCPKRSDLDRAFGDLLINPQMFAKLGPAISSGRGMFLFGYPGNGKTSIAERVTAAFGKYVWVPRALEVEGAIMRLFDPMVHELAMPEACSGLLDTSFIDKRWVRIKRPTIVVGGELTMDMLEVQRNPETNINESPLQMKSNCGTLVIDDFGRQKMSVDQLLNRWIIPLEKRYDFLNMANGKKIEVPFDQLVIFSTNLEPKDLVDDAFLRRIPYKIEVPNPSEADFRKLFEIMCRITKVPYKPEPIDYLIKTHYLPAGRPFRNCQPRDLLLQVKNYCTYNERPVELTNENFDFAVENYFSVM